MKRPLLLRLLGEPAVCAGFDLADWDLVLRQASSGMVAASVAALLEDHGLLAGAPEQARTHLAWSAVHAAHHRQAVFWELDRIGHALAATGVDVTLLKGAAYAAAGLAAGRGRLFSDIDILVARAELDAVESALLLNGWAATLEDAYDQRYYREWMHELPPMTHRDRGTSIDVHHAIVPLTAPIHPDPAKLRASAVALPGPSPFRVLAPADMVLHSAVHLFHDGELDHGTRDLFDLHRLLGEFAQVAGFWPALAARAHELELSRPLFYALRYTSMLLGTPVPAAALAGGARGEDGGDQPSRVLLALMDGLFLRALLPDHASCDSALTGAARFLLYVRANWLRMPPLLLARHLFHKAFLSPKAA